MKNKNIIIVIILIIIILIIGIILLLPKTFKKTYSASTTLVETVKTLSKGSSWSSGASGVYQTNGHEYRYVGANVNNFVSFNGEKYRIIGVFDENSHGVKGKELVKLIRSRIIGSYSWGVYNTTATSGTYSSYKNDWTGNTTGVKANLNILLNEFFYTKKNLSSTYGACKDWTYSYNENDYKTTDCANIIGYGIDSGLQKYIQEATWHLKGYINGQYSKQDFYTCERSGETEITSCTSAKEGTYNLSAIANIGLMYVSDYLYASGYYSSDDTTVASGSSVYHMNQNWLYQGFDWTITPDGDNGNSAFLIGTNGNLTTDATAFGTGVRPTFYLKSDVYVTGGDGSFDNPYTIGYDSNNAWETLVNLELDDDVAGGEIATFTGISTDNDTGIYPAEDVLELHIISEEM